MISTSHRTTVRVAALGLSASLVASGLAGCGSSKKNDAKAATLAGSSAASSSNSAAPSGPLTVEKLKSALLTPADVGSGFTQGTDGDDDSPMPCAAKGSATMDKQAPPSLQAGTEIDNDSLEASFNEQVKVYKDASASAAALAIAHTGLKCTAGTIYASDGTAVPVTIAEPQDLSSQVNVKGYESVTGWEIATAEDSGIAIAAKSGPRLVLLTFISPTSADDSKLPDAVDTTVKALTKLVQS